MRRSSARGRWAQTELVHGGQWTRAARGVAERAIVTLFFASSNYLAASLCVYV